MKTDPIISFVLAPAYSKRHGLNRRALIADATNRYEAILRMMEQEYDYGPDENPMAYNMNLAAAFFAFYDATSRELTEAEALDILKSRLPSRIPLLTSAINRHFPAVAKLYLKHGRKLAKNISDHQAKGEWADSWSIREGVPGHEKAIDSDGESFSMTFTSCPIAKFAREKGYEKIVGAACKSDYLTAHLLGLELIRPHTIAEGYETCPYTYIPEKNMKSGHNNGV